MQTVPKIADFADFFQNLQTWLRRSWAGCVLHADWLSTFWGLQRQLPMRTAQSQTHGHDIPTCLDIKKMSESCSTVMICYVLLRYTYFAVNLIASIRNWDLCMSMKNHLLSVSLSPAFLHRSVPCHVLKNVPQCPASVAAMALVLSDHTLHRWTKPTIEADFILPKCIQALNRSMAKQIMIWTKFADM